MMLYRDTTLATVLGALVLGALAWACFRDACYEAPSTYLEPARCSNCNSGRVSIPRGTPYAEFDFTAARCVFCGCPIQGPTPLR